MDGAVPYTMSNMKSINIPTKGYLEITASTRLPHFVIIGAQKGGTTWLQDILHQHPNIHIPPDFYESHFFNRSIEEFENYVNFFNQPEAVGKVLGERSPNYFDMPKARIEYMKKVLPDVKLIVVLREPISRAWAHARMELSNYQDRKLTKYDTNNALLHIGSIRNVCRTDYASLLANWLAVYPYEQFFVAFHDELSQNPIAFLKRFYRFLGVDNFFPKDVEKNVFDEYELNIPISAVWFLQSKYRTLPSKLQCLDIQVPTSWQQTPVNLAWWKKAQIWLWIVPRNVLFDITYSVYKKRKEEQTPIPEVVFTTSQGQ